jgi:hypothetical protein
MARALGRNAVFYWVTRTSSSLHRLDEKIKQLKSLLVRAADALEKSPSDTDTQLVEELRKAAEQTTDTSLRNCYRKIDHTI